MTIRLKCSSCDEDRSIDYATSGLPEGLTAPAIIAGRRCLARRRSLISASAEVGVLARIASEVCTNVGRLVLSLPPSPSKRPSSLLITRRSGVDGVRLPSGSGCVRLHHRVRLSQYAVRHAVLHVDADSAWDDVLPCGVRVQRNPTTFAQVPVTCQSHYRLTNNHLCPRKSTSSLPFADQSSFRCRLRSLSVLLLTARPSVRPSDAAARHTVHRMSVGIGLVQSLGSNL